MQISKIIQRAVELGEIEGEITFDQLNELFGPHRNVEPEVFERLFEALSDAGINVVER